MTDRKFRSSSCFHPISLQGIYNREIQELNQEDCSKKVLDNREHLLRGENTLWGIPFQLGDRDAGKDILFLKDQQVRLKLSPDHARHQFLVFLHSVDFNKTPLNEHDIFSPMMGNPRLGETVCDYILEYADGTMHSVPIQRRRQISEFQVGWGENGFECVTHLHPTAIPTSSEQVFRGTAPEREWGFTQYRVTPPGEGALMQHWLYGLENPHPDKDIASVLMIPRGFPVFIFGITGTALTEHPLRWDARKKVEISLSDIEKLKTLNDEDIQQDISVPTIGDYLTMGLDDKHIQLDMGEIISISPVLDYEHSHWEDSYNQKLPTLLSQKFIIEYTSHPDASFHIGENEPIRVPVKTMEQTDGFIRVKEALQMVTIKIMDKNTGKIVPAKIHVHGEHGEYLSPINRHRIPNPFWFEDYSADYVHGPHYSTYTHGEADFKLPLGEVYIEVSKGFEIKPVRKKIQIKENTDTAIIELEHILPWRQKGWVTADTHVHFLSPQTALLEGEAEGVNIINLLASQWGEMFSNIGDFDGKTTIGSKEAGGSGEFLVKVGTENRQQILGHISLLGYEGKMILPLSTGGPNESALGDPVESTITEWARRCREQNGLSILPHIPNPRAEGAAALVLEQIDAVEMCSWGDLYGGISPYSLSDWYRYLNCGYQVPAVGGTDKMSAEIAVGTIRTYAQIKDKPFTYENWMESVRKGSTFVTYGPLLDFTVDGKNMGTQMELPHGGGTLDVHWQVSSVTVPVTKLELIVNGEIKEIKTFDPENGNNHSGSWSLHMNQSGWIAIRVRGRYPDKEEMIAAHSSAVMVVVDRSRCLNAVDAMTILEQIEGTSAYLKTIATRAEEKVYKNLLLTLTSAHRALHNRMHRQGIDHKHTVVDDHHNQ